MLEIKVKALIKVKVKVATNSLKLIDNFDELGVGLILPYFCWKGIGEGVVGGETGASPPFPMLQVSG